MLNMLGCTGPYLYKQPERREPAQVARAPVGCADDKGKVPMVLDMPPPDAAHGGVQPSALLRQDGAVLLSDSDSELSEPQGKMPKKNLMTYQRRRSERIRKMQDGVRMGSVERASQRKASSDEGSGPSPGSTSTRRRKTRNIPDINVVAPMPITETPASSSR